MDETRRLGNMTRRSMLRAVLATASTIAGAGLLAACGPAPAPTAAPVPTTAAAAAATRPPAAATTAPATAPTPTAAAQQSASGQKVIIKVFNRGTPANETVKGGADEYAKAHPNVTIDWQSAPSNGEDLRKMLILAASNTMPDIQWQCLGCNYDVYILAGLYSDIEPLAKAHNFPFDKYVPNTIEAGRRGGKLYGLPSATHPDYPCMIVNKTMFDKSGVPFPKEDWTTGEHPGWKGWTYDAFQQAAIAMTKKEGGRYTQWGFQNRGAANPLQVLREAMKSEGGREADMLSTDGKVLQWDSAVGRKVTKIFFELYTKYHTAPTTADMPQGGPDLMGSGRVAIRPAPVWAIGTAQANFKDFEWKVIPMPLGAQGVDGAVDVNFFSIPKSSTQPDIAMDVLIQMLDPRWVWASVEIGGLPGPHKEFWSADSKLVKDPAWALFAKYMNTVSPQAFPANSRSTEFSNTWMSGTDPVWLGTDGLDSDKLIDSLMPKLKAIVESKPPTIQELATPS